MDPRIGTPSGKKSERGRVARATNRPVGAKNGRRFSCGAGENRIFVHCQQASRNRRNGLRRTAGRKATDFMYRFERRTAWLVPLVALFVWLGTTPAMARVSVGRGAACAVTAAGGADPRDRSAMTGDERRPKVGVVLSGGGAKGVAHIGILKVLEEAGMPIDYIAGTSMGAIIGGLYAIGWTTSELDSLVRNQDWAALLSDKLSRNDQLLAEKEAKDTYLLSVPLSLTKKFSIPSGVLAGQSVLNLLNEMTLGYHDDDLNFDSLPIPFACVAYDMVKGQEVVFRSGNLPRAIRASMSIPGAFVPVSLDGMALVDGGIYNNFPVDVVREMGADIVIGVDLASEKPVNEETLQSFGGLFNQVTSILGRERYTENLKHVDLYLHPDVYPYSSSSFSASAVDSLLLRGERCARQHWEDIVALQERVYTGSDYMTSRKRILVNDSDSLQVGTIEFVGLTNNEERFMRRALGIREHTTVTKGELYNAIGKVRGSGAFSFVTYTLESKPPYALQITVNEKQPAAVNIGFRFDSEEMASILLNSTLTLRGLQGPKLGFTLRLNENPYLKLDFLSSNILRGRLGLSYMFRSNNYQLYKNGRQYTNVTFGQNRVELFFSLANPRWFNPRIGINYEHFNYNSFLFVSDADRLAVTPKGFVNYFLMGDLETFDNHYFPTRGISAYAKATLHTDNGYSYEGTAPFGSLAYHVRYAFSPAKFLTVIPSIWGRSLIGQPVAYSYYNYIGGEVAGRYMEQQVPFVGIHHMEEANRSLITFQAEVRARVASNHYVSVKAAYGLQNRTFFGMFTRAARPDDMWGVGVQYSYASPIGPISLQFDYSDLSRFGAYFSLGKTF